MNHRMSRSSAVTVMACVAILDIVAMVGTNIPAADELPRLRDMALTDLSGQRHIIGGLSRGKLTVLIFLGTQCPISNSYAPALKRLYDGHAGADVDFLGVHSDTDVSAEIARAHAREYELPFPLVLDHDQRLAQACGVKTVPTAIVIDASGRLMYRGRIDNRFVALGQRRPEATVFDLQRALESALAGQEPNPSTTEAVGCPLPLLRQ
jgi:peroxiredoxin